MTYDEILNAYTVLADAYAANPTQANYDKAKAYYDGTLLPAVPAAQAAYATAQGQYDADLNAYNTAVAAQAAYPVDLAARLQSVRDSFGKAIYLGNLDDLFFTPAWVGPFGYGISLGNWIAGTELPLTKAVTDLQRGVKDKLVKAGMGTVEWEQHVDNVVALGVLRENPPSPVPQPPVKPVAPVVPLEPAPPAPPVVGTAAYRADPAGYTVVATGARVLDARVLNKLWSTMKPGEIVDLAPGSYKRMDAAWPTALRPLGSKPITFRGIKSAAGVRPKILRNDPPSGGSNAIFVGPGASHVRFESLDIEADDTAGVMTSSGLHRDFIFKDCRLFGYFDPRVAGSKDDSKWGFLTNDHDAWTLENVEIFGVYGEHAWYGHNRAGPLTWRDVYLHHCQRTALQDVSRPAEGKAGVGDVLLERVTIKEVCKEDGGGGSAITCRGGNKDATWTLRDVLVEQGCDASIVGLFADQVTGCVVFDNGSGGSYGGTKAVIFERCTFRMGLVQPGVGNSRRSNVKLEVVDSVVFTDCVIENGPLAHQIALEIATTVPKVSFKGTNTIVGKIKYHGKEHATFAAFKSAHPECFV